jgi:SAM-dependent methyltransferase
MSWRKFLAIPQLLWYAVRAPREQARAWDRFWGGVRKTGMGGDVIWDSASKDELDALREKVLAHFDRSLPVVDIGSGNGRQACLFAREFPKVVGVEVSPNAVRHAKEAAAGLENCQFIQADASIAGTLRPLVAGQGDVNVHIRGVFHVLTDAGRRALAKNIEEIVGRRGTVYLFETNIEGDPLDHLEFQGATLTSMPDPLRRCIEAGIRPPSHFGDEQLRTYFSPSTWEVVESGRTVAHGIPLHEGREIELIPSYYAILKPRAREDASRLIS